jgi:hypothetical protein
MHDIKCPVFKAEQKLQCTCSLQKLFPDVKPLPGGDGWLFENFKDGLNSRIFDCNSILELGDSFDTSIHDLLKEAWTRGWMRAENQVIKERG